MTSEEFIERVLALGYDVHINDGIWWIEAIPFFYKPVIPYQVIERGTAKPKMHKALLGYTHHVSDKKYANHYEAILLLNEERLKSFGMKSLSSSVRARVRKGSKLTEIKIIEEIETVIDELREVEISKALRTGHGKPAEYFIKHEKEWRAWTIKQFYEKKGKKDYWGSFYNGSLIALISISLVDGTLLINNATSHTDHMKKCPNDALVFSILDHYKQLEECKRVSYGQWSMDRPDLNRYKEKFGFERVDLPIYAKHNFLIIPLVKKLIAHKQLNKINKLIKSYLFQFSR